MTFAALILVFHATPAVFRTTWFVESLLTELVVALVIRTRRPFFRSRPGSLLVASTGVVIALALVLPYVPFAGVLGFVPLPGHLLAAVITIASAYVLATGLQKRWFYRREQQRLRDTAG